MKTPPKFTPDSIQRLRGSLKRKPGGNPLIADWAATSAKKVPWSIAFAVRSKAPERWKFSRPSVYVPAGKMPNPKKYFPMEPNEFGVRFG